MTQLANHRLSTLLRTSHLIGIFLISTMLIANLAKADILGTYYNQNGTARAYFTGTAVTRIDSNINFSWGGGSPITGVGTNDFSIRWVGEVEIPVSGDYTFTTRSDDGVRLSVNGTSLIDNWTDHGPTFNSGNLTGLIAGQRYTIEMEFYERGGGARAELYWQGPGFNRQVIPATRLFLNSTPPQVVSAVAPCDNGSILLSFNEPVTAASAENLANYTANNGVVLTSASLASSGDMVTLNYFAGNGNNFDLTVAHISDTFGNVMATSQTTPVSVSSNGLAGSYYDQNGASGQYFTGTGIQQNDLTVDFNWATGAPLSGIGRDYFSIRWQGEIEAPSDGDYTFYTVSDDGVRLYLDNNLIINNWTAHSSTTNTSAPQTLVAGQRYPLTLEFYEQSGYAEIRLQWQGPGFTRTTVPSTQLYSTCPISATTTVGNWRLDENSWSGNSDDVIDESANGLNGRAINLNGLPSKAKNNPALIGAYGTCGYGNFNGTADGYLRIDDPGSNSPLDVDNQYSLGLWVYPRTLPNAGKLSTLLSKGDNYQLQLNSSGQVVWWWGGGDRELIANSSVSTYQWHYITATYVSGAQVIYIDGNPAGTHTSTSALDVNNNPLVIAADNSDPTQRFDGLIDEVQLLDGALSASEVNQLMAQTHACPISQVDHYVITHSGNGITCEASNITINAHDNNHIDADASGITIQLSTHSSTAGWLASDSVWSLKAGNGSLTSSSSGVAEYTFASGESSADFYLSNTRVANIDIDIVDTADTSITEFNSVSEDPLLVFTDSALRFYNDANQDGNADGTDPITGPFIAGDTSTNFVLKAIATDTETGACITRVLGNQTVELAYECRNPSTCVRDKDMLINTIAIEDNNADTVVNFSAQTFTFDSEGEVAMNLRYFDAGRVRLHANTTLPATSSEPAITLTGTSAEFVVKPSDLVISEVTKVGGNTNPATTNTGLGFVSAGTPFRVMVEARNSNGGLTPNFGQESTPAQPELKIANLIFPAGGNNPALNAATNFVISSAGQFENTHVSWAEAGTISINAHILGSDYLGAGDVNGTVSGHIGRFHPAYLQLDNSLIGAGCSSGNFSYMSDQAASYRPLSFYYTVSAQGNGTGVLQNYDASLAYPVTSLQGMAEDGNNGTNLSARSVIPTASWQSGQMIVSDTGAFTRALSGSHEIADGPYTALQFAIAASGGLDNEDFTTSAKNLNPDTSNDCSLSGNCSAIALGTSQQLRFGRLYGNSVFGPEVADLTVPLRIQYWNTHQFVDNSDDSCTVIPASDTFFDGANLSNDAHRTVNIGAGSSTGNFANATAGLSFGFIAGDAELNVSAPGSGNVGAFDIDIDLSNTPWLRSDWNQDGDNANDTSLPSINIRFGSYRGHDRIIFWQEIL